MWSLVCEARERGYGMPAPRVYWRQTLQVGGYQFITFLLMQQGPAMACTQAVQELLDGNEARLKVENFYSVLANICEATAEHHHINFLLL